MNLTDFTPVKVGDKVKLDIKAIKSEQGYPRNKLSKYGEWIEENAEKEFVATRNENGVCDLRDGDEDVVWLFWERHLRKIK